MVTGLVMKDTLPVCVSQELSKTVFVLHSAFRNTLGHVDMCPDRTTHKESDSSTFEVERLEWSPIFTVLETWTIIVLAQLLLIKQKSPCLLIWASGLLTSMQGLIVPKHC